jgi:signal transduction histidine kinase
MPIVEATRPSAGLPESVIRTVPMAHGGSSPSLRWPIRWRLPLLICGLLLATVAAFASVTYWYLEQALLDATQQRLQNVARQMASLLSTSAQQRQDEALKLAAAPEVTALLAAPEPDPGTREAAARTVNAFLKSSPQTVGVEIWRNSGERVMTSVQPLATKPNTPPPPPRQDRLTDPGPTPVAAANDLVYYEVMGEGLGGSVVIRRAVSSSAASEAFSRLAGDVSMMFGAVKGGIWADLAGVRPRPPVEEGQNKAADYYDDAGTYRIGTAVAITGTPWQIWVSMPRSIALSPANNFVASMLPLGLIVALIGAGVTWVLASRIIRPLEELTHAAEDIAAGDLTRHVTTSARDEIGRLGLAFNTMVDKVADGYHQLDERVQARTAELQAKTGELQERTGELEQALTTLKDTQDELVRREKLAILGQLASGVGHELRNPLAVMTNAVYFLEMIQPDAPDVVREYHGLLRAQIGLSEKIVGDLLDFARIKPPRRERVPLTRILDDQIARLSTVDGLTIERDIAADLPDAYVDPIQIGQVVFNLLVNAMQAMEAQIGHGKDSGVLTLRGRATPAADGSAPIVALDVIDTGPGVPPDLQSKIFEALFTTKARGIGLGLSVSRSLAESNGGTLTLSSTSPAGATFTLTLPGAQS